MRCGKCGYHIKGKKHTEGEHHKKGELGHTDIQKISKAKKELEG